MQIAKILGSQQGAVLPIQNRLSRHDKLLLCGSHRLRKVTLLKHLGCRREFCNDQLLRTPVMLDDHDLHIQTSELALSRSGRQHHIVCLVQERVLQTASTYERSGAQSHGETSAASRAGSYQ